MKKVENKANTIKMTNLELMNIADSLTYLADKETSAWYEISRNLRIVKPIMEEANEIRQGFAKNLAKKDKKGQPVVENNRYVWKSKEAELEQQKIWNEFINEEVEIKEFRKFDISKLEGIKLHGGLLSNLLDIIIIDNE